MNDQSSSVLRPPSLILGLGNPLQADDGVGCRVAEALAGRALPPGVEVMDAGTPGVGLINLLEGRQRAIMVDAAEMGRPAGEVVRFRPEDVVLTGSTERFSLHRRLMLHVSRFTSCIGGDLWRKTKATSS
ncbi:MAG: hydrogenase maturation protease [Anaerolineae bacterium]|nr:hydrogenase maturation protease [Anaerolineae bacterium]